MAWSPLLLFALSSLLFATSAFDLTGRIQRNDFLPDFEGLEASKITLDNGRMQGGIMHDGSFVIPDVPAGTYILSVSSPNHSFDQYRVDVFDSQMVPEVRPYAVGTPINPPSSVLLPHPITLVPRQKHTYFVPPESFSLITIFSNPMMLLMVLGGVIMLAMPYLVSNMDHEATTEFREQHAKVTGTPGTTITGNLITGEESSDFGGQPPKNPSSTKSRGNNKSKKR